MCERINFGYKYKLIELSIQCCAECYLHKQDHMQIEYASKINQIEEELRRTFNDCPIIIRKNQNNLKPRLHSFELRYKRLFIFSKLNNGNFPKPQDIATLILCLSTKTYQQILTIKNNLTTYYSGKDLYSFLKSKSKSVKLPYKLVMNQIDKIIRVGIRIEPIVLKVTHVSQNAENSQQLTKRNNTSRFKYKSQRNLQKSNIKLSIMKQKQNCPDYEQQQYYKHYMKKSRNTSIDKISSKKNSHRRISSILKQQVLVEKYSYLTKQMDIIPGNQYHIDGIFNGRNSRQESFEILQLSIDENQQSMKKNDWSQQQLQKRRIQQGVNFKLLATHTQKQTSKKYSSEYKKFAEMLEKQLKQDQILEKQKIKYSKSSFGQSQQKNKQKMVSSDQMSISSENNRSYFDISMKDLESKIQLLIFSTKKEINQTSNPPIQPDTQVQDQNNMPIIVENLEQKAQQSNPSLKKYYEQGFIHEKITGLIETKQQKEIYIDNHYLAKYEGLCKVLTNIHEQYPQIFKQVLQNFNIQEIKLQNTLSEYSLVLFNPILGVFMKSKLRIQLSFQYQGYIPHWALVVCQAIQPFLQENSIKICEILKLITGAPLVKIAASDLRKIRKILVQSNFSGNQQIKQKVICTGDGNDRDNLQYCEMLQFKKHKDILLSEITYKEYVGQQRKQKIIETKTYQQFAIKYQTIMLWMYQSNFYHNQRIIKFQTNQEEYMKKIVNPTCKIKFSLNENSRIFLEFNQHSKLEKPNHILISKIIQRQDNIELQPIGELHKKGNFFFQLSLEPASYFVQISRCFGYQEVNSMHFYSSSQIHIHKFVVDYEKNEQFLANI